MSKQWIAIILGIATGLGMDSAAAQQVLDTRMRGVMLTGLVGGAAYTDLQRVAAPGSTVGPLRRITADTSPVLAAAVGVWPSRYWGVRFHGSFAPTRLELREEGETLEASGLDARVSGSHVGVWTADVSFMIRAPVTPGGRVVPYVLLGGGIIGFAADRGGFLGAARVLEKGAVRPAGVIGLGAHVPLQRNNLALTFELTDHIFSTPIRNDTGSAGLEPAGDQVGVSNQIRLLTGLTLRLH